MDSSVNLIFTAFLIVAVLSALYQVLPSKPLPKARPSFALFPKYHFSFQNIETLKRNLHEEGFIEAERNRFVRGHLFGDFLTKWTKLTVTIDDAKRSARLGSPLIAIAFDTGDLWDLVTKLTKSD